MMTIKLNGECRNNTEVNKTQMQFKTRQYFYFHSNIAVEVYYDTIH